MASSKSITLGLIALTTLLGSATMGTSAIAQERSQCFMVGANGELLDLTSVCSPPSAMGSKTKTEPIPETNPQANPEPTPSPEATPQPPDGGGNPESTPKTPSNPYIRYGGTSSGTTEDSGTVTRKRKDQRADLRRQSAQQRAAESQSQ